MIMQTIDFFVAIAEIAGVFVGFGALISVTRRTKFEFSQIGRIRAVVTIGLLVIIAALIPVVLSSYGLSDGNLWFLSSFLYLILNLTVMLLSLLRSENRVLLAAQSRANPLTAGFFWLLLEIPVQVPLILILVGSWQDLELAFYATALVFNLFEAAYVLAQLVYAQEISTKR
jgi:hypothetical protein